MESEPQLDTTSLLDRQLSGIRAFPSHDDDDDDDDDYVVETNNSPENMI